MGKRPCCRMERQAFLANRLNKLNRRITTMARGFLLWLLGVPFGLIVILWLFGILH